MTAPLTRLATDDDMRAITTKNLDDIAKLPRLYIPTDDGLVMRSWGVAHVSTIGDYARLFPGALVAPHDFGQFADRDDLAYNDADPVIGVLAWA